MKSCCTTKNTLPETSDRVEGITHKSGIQAYRPLVVMVLVTLAGSVALSCGAGIAFMPIFMGLFLLCFSMVKLFDLEGFATDFSRYDILAKRSMSYARLYPFIEMALALGFLYGKYPAVIHGVTALVMAIGLVGIIPVMRSGRAMRCACMGSMLDVPVGSVTVLENTTMLLMAIAYFVIG